MIGGLSLRPRIAFLTVQLEFDGTYPDLLVQAALRAAERHDCDLIVVPGREWGAGIDGEGVMTAVYRLLPSWPLDAVILSPPVTNLRDAAALARDAAVLAPLPLVSMIERVGGAPCVGLDAVSGVGESVRHLVREHGRRRVACLRGPVGHRAADDRFRAWQQALVGEGLSADPSLVAEVEFTEKGVAEAVAMLLARGPLDGLCAVSDLVALAAIAEFERRGLRVPQDVSVVGYDDLPLSAASDPPLTTVSQDLQAQLDAAMALAASLARGQPVGPGPVVGTRLVARRSCGCSWAGSEASPPQAPPQELQRRLERLATFHLGLGHRDDEQEFHHWLRLQFPHQGFAGAILALGHSEVDTDPAVAIPSPPRDWSFPLGEGWTSLWGSGRRSRVALPLASGRLWFGLLVLDLVADGALVYRGIQSGLTRRYREIYERGVLVARSVEEATAKRVEQEKMRALGTLVAGVAHEVNTPLGTAITAASYLEGLLKGHDRGEPLDTALVMEALTLLRNNLDRAADLITRFKRVSVERTIEALEPLDLTQFLADLLPSVTFPLRRARIDLEARVAPGLRLTTSAAALFDIFTNLTQNVLDHAYPHGGPGRVHLTAEPRSQGGVVLTFSDEGQGMNEETRLRVFDPFFTTRRGNGGTGLGLHLVYNLVHQRLNGQISCRSVLHHGTTFRIELP